MKDYGAVGDGNIYDRDAVLAAFKAAAALAEQGTPSKLEFEAGKTYKINEKQDAFALFDLDNINYFFYILLLKMICYILHLLLEILLTLL